LLLAAALIAAFFGGLASAAFCDLDCCCGRGGLEQRLLGGLGDREGADDVGDGVTRGIGEGDGEGDGEA
jgi:hypothetical protein